MSTQTHASQKKNPNRIRLRADDRAMAILCYGIVGLFSFYVWFRSGMCLYIRLNRTACI